MGFAGTLDAGGAAKKTGNGEPRIASPSSVTATS